jgi:hypothetical protein
MHLLPHCANLSLDFGIGDIGYRGLTVQVIDQLRQLNVKLGVRDCPGNPGPVARVELPHRSHQLVNGELYPDVWDGYSG